MKIKKFKLIFSLCPGLRREGLNKIRRIIDLTRELNYGAVIHDRLRFNNFKDSLDSFCNCGRHIETTLFTSFSPITQIKEKLFPIKLVTSNVFYSTKMIQL